MIPFKNVLVLSPHADDMEFGCGGTVARLVGEGIKVSCVVFSKATRALPDGYTESMLMDEIRAARKTLGFGDTEGLYVFDFPVREFPGLRQNILNVMIGIRNGVNPDLVIMPLLNDVHQDHSTVAREAIRAFKRTTIWGYELPWNNLSSNCQLSIILDPSHIWTKIAALDCYKSQQHRDYNDSNYIESLAVSRGTIIGAPYAEAFEVYRWIL